VDIKNHYSSGWKGYQGKLKREERRKALMKKLPVVALYSGSCLLFLFFVFYTGSRLLGHLKGDGYSPVHTQKAPVVIRQKMPDQDFSFELKDLDLVTRVFRIIFLFRGVVPALRSIHQLMQAFKIISFPSLNVPGQCRQL
jgi:hypothetical protein